MRTVCCFLTTVLLGACGLIESAPGLPPAKQAYAGGKHVVGFNNDAIDGYVARLPPGYSPEETYPMIVAFHGAVGDAETAYRRWAYSGVEFILVCPNGTARMGWEIGVGQLDLILACMDDAQARFSVDPSRVFLTGHSMGGHVSWNLALFHGERFAAVAPTASAPMYLDKLDNLLSMPILVVHGRDYPVVSLEHNRQAEEYINSRGGSMTLVLVENAGHGFIAAQQDGIVSFFRGQ